MWFRCDDRSVKWRRETYFIINNYFFLRISTIFLSHKLFSHIYLFFKNKTMKHVRFISDISTQSVLNNQIGIKSRGSYSEQNNLRKSYDNTLLRIKHLFLIINIIGKRFPGTEYNSNIIFWSSSEDQTSNIFVFRCLNCIPFLGPQFLTLSKKCFNLLSISYMDSIMYYYYNLFIFHSWKPSS